MKWKSCQIKRTYGTLQAGMTGFMRFMHHGRLFDVLVPGHKTHSTVTGPKQGVDYPRLPATIRTDHSGIESETHT